MLIAFCLGINLLCVKLVLGNLRFLLLLRPASGYLFASLAGQNSGVETSKLYQCFKVVDVMVSFVGKLKKKKKRTTKAKAKKKR